MMRLSEEAKLVMLLVLHQARFPSQKPIVLTSPSKVLDSLLESELIITKSGRRYIAELPRDEILSFVAPYLLPTDGLKRNWSQKKTADWVCENLLLRSPQIADQIFSIELAPQFFGIESMMYVQLYAAIYKNERHCVIYHYNLSGEEALVY